MLKQKLQADQIVALKTGEKKRLEVLRYILAQIINKEIDKREDLTDEEAIAVLRKLQKELAESIDAFAKGGRKDLVQEHQYQADVVKTYLPAEISDQELTLEIVKIIKNNQTLYNENPKKIIGVCMGQLKEKAAPQRILQTLKAIETSREE